MSALTGDITKRTAVMHAEDFFTKPLDLNRLEKRIAELLHRNYRQLTSACWWKSLWSRMSASRWSLPAGAAEARRRGLGPPRRPLSWPMAACGFGIL